MKRYVVAVTSVLLGVSLQLPGAQGQDLTQSPQSQRVRDALLALQTLQGPGQRSGGGRGARAAIGDVYRDALNNYYSQVTGAWWTNTALVERLGLTDDQKANIERAFENHRQSIVSSTDQLEKEEAQLGRLLEAEAIDRNAVLTQIDRVIQARGEVERANSAMTLEMREHLTREQWLQLPRTAAAAIGAVGIRGGGGRGAPPAAGGRRGGRGQQ